MVRNYWVLFYLTLIGMIIFVLLFILGFIFAKKIFLNKKYGIILLILCSCASFALSILCANTFTLCCKDYCYVSNNIEIQEIYDLDKFIEEKFVLEKTLTRQVNN